MWDVRQGFFLANMKLGFPECCNKGREAFSEMMENEKANLGELWEIRNVCWFFWEAFRLFRLRK